MAYDEMFNLNGVEIRTYVTKKKKKIDEVLQSFLYPSNGDKDKVIGFDIEWHMSEKVMSNGSIPESKCATLHLCNGIECLIIQLLHLRSMPVSLLNFLRLPDYTFVGIGIKDDLDKLEGQCGIRCRNAVELGPLAASIMKMPRLSACGIDALSIVVNNVDLRKHRPSSVAFDDWGGYELSKKHAKLATTNVYSFYNVGSKLFASTD